MKVGLGKFRNKLARTDNLVITLQCIAVGQFVVILYLMTLYSSAKEDQLFRVPPDLRQGVVMRANDVAPPTVFTYAFYILQQLHNWEESGDVDYPKNIYRLQAFLTPKFREYLSEEVNTKSKDGELGNRVRKINEIVGRGYTNERVAIESEDSWIVWLDVEIKETVYGRGVKNAFVQYPLRVVRYDVDPEKNPWGLAIDGYAGALRSLTDNDIKQAFARKLQ